LRHSGDFGHALKLTSSMRRTIVVGCVFSAHQLLTIREVLGMKLRTILTAAALATVFAAAPGVSQAHNYGDWDEHHVWRDAGWWHEHRPGWVWRHHPEWVEEHPNWRAIDGDWDEHHVWRDRGWWYEHHPEWVHRHHPDWVRWRD